jgi:multicomponent Na+:H+ antiporter subunit C
MSALSAPTLFGLCAAALVGLGLYGLIVQPSALRKVLAFNLVGSGVFLIFGVIARRGAAAGMPGDPVPQALVITGLVVAFSATAMAVALLLRLREVEDGDERAAAGADGPGSPHPGPLPAGEGTRVRTALLDEVPSPAGRGLG